MGPLRAALPPDDLAWRGDEARTAQIAPGVEIRPLRRGGYGAPFPVDHDGLTAFFEGSNGGAFRLHNTPILDGRVLEHEVGEDIRTGDPALRLRWKHPRTLQLRGQASIDQTVFIPIMPGVQIPVFVQSGDRAWQIGLAVGRQLPPNTEVRVRADRDQTTLTINPKGAFKNMRSFA
jgi:hypothetical protein